MFRRRTTATLLGAGLTLACLTTGAAAHAAPAPHSTSNSAAGTAFSSTRTITPNTVTSTATIDGDRAIVTLTGQPGQKITIHDSTGRPIAGTTLTKATGTITFTAPTSHQTYTVHADGQAVDSAAFSLCDDIVTPDTKPVVDDVDKQGARAIVDVTAAPRALVKVKNDNGKTLGLRMADKQGPTSIPVPVAPNDDTALKVSQTNAGQESDDEEAYSLTELTSVDVTYTGVTDALLNVKAFIGGTLQITDESGKTIWNKPMSDKPEGSRAVVPVVTGKTVTYTLTRSNAFGVSKPTTIEVTGNGTPLEAPTAKQSPAFPTLLTIKGVPGVGVNVVHGEEGDTEGRWETYGTFNASGSFNLQNVKPGDTFTITQEFGGDTSPATVFTVPGN